MTMNPRQSAQKFEFTDNSPIRLGRKHRRGKGHSTSTNKKTSLSTESSSDINNNSAANGSIYVHGNKSYRSGGHNYYSPAASEASSSLHALQQHPHHANYYTGDAWENHHYNGNNTNKDDNSCTGSLTYSASSSVQDESSNDSSFADIIKLIDSEGGEGSSEMKDFLAKQSKAAIGTSNSNIAVDAMSGKIAVSENEKKDAAVAGWMQRVEHRSRLQHQHTQLIMQDHTQRQMDSRGQLFSMEQSQNTLSNSNVELNYSKDDSSEDDVFGVEFDDKIVLETIAGLDDDTARQVNVTVVTQHQPMYTENSVRSTDSHQTTNARAVQTFLPRGLAGGQVTPPPSSRHKRASTPPGAKTISRQNSRHSKSSSDGSWDTPAPSSPPNNTKPPHASRSVPVSSSRRKPVRDEKVVEDLSEAFYTKSWMCGFADAFNFDGFDKFQK